MLSVAFKLIIHWFPVGPAGNGPIPIEVDGDTYKLVWVDTGMGAPYLDLQ
jgi:hypothetical protein